MAMTQAEFRSALKRHNVALGEFAGWAGMSRETVYKWGSTIGVPRIVVRVLSLMDQHGARAVMGRPVEAIDEEPVVEITAPRRRPGRPRKSVAA